MYAVPQIETHESDLIGEGWFRFGVPGNSAKWEWLVVSEAGDEHGHQRKETQQNWVARGVHYASTLPAK